MPGRRQSRPLDRSGLRSTIASQGRGGAIRLRDSNLLRQLCSGRNSVVSRAPVNISDGRASTEVDVRIRLHGAHSLGRGYAPNVDLIRAALLALSRGAASRSSIASQSRLLGALIAYTHLNPRHPFFVLLAWRSHLMGYWAILRIPLAIILTLALLEIGRLLGVGSQGISLMTSLPLVFYAWSLATFLCLGFGFWLACRNLVSINSTWMTAIGNAGRVFEARLGAILPNPNPWSPSLEPWSLIYHLEREIEIATTLHLRAAPCPQRAGQETTRNSQSLGRFSRDLDLQTTTLIPTLEGRSTAIVSTTPNSGAVAAAEGGQPPTSTSTSSDHQPTPLAPSHTDECPPARSTTGDNKVPAPASFLALVPTHRFFSRSSRVLPQSGSGSLESTPPDSPAPATLHRTASWT